MIAELFASHVFTTAVIFAHVISAVVWVGGMIALRFAVHPSMMLIATPEVRISRSLHFIRRFFYIVVPFILTLLATGILMIYGLGHKGKMIVHIKEALWLIMALNFISMFIRRSKAEQLLKDGKIADAKAIMGLISGYMLPANIIFGIVAIYFGVSLRF